MLVGDYQKIWRGGAKVRGHAKVRRETQMEGSSDKTRTFGHEKGRVHHDVLAKIRADNLSIQYIVQLLDSAMDKFREWI